MWPQRCGSPHVSPPYKARQEDKKAYRTWLVLFWWCSDSLRTSGFVDAIIGVNFLIKVGARMASAAHEDCSGSLGAEPPSKGAGNHFGFQEYK